jgi:DNA-binding winged helix-turn-helix (wHTH) protein
LIYRFEGFSLDHDRRELRRGSEIIDVEPQVFDVLEFLVVNRERVVSNDDLIEGIWRGRIVSDGTVSTRINAVRRAINDSGERQRLIRTVPRRGYRFVGSIRQEPGERYNNSATSVQPALSMLGDKPSTRDPN